MSTSSFKHRSGRAGRAVLAGLLASLLAAPVNAAIEIPNNPLVTGGNVPPNIMFILDTSGSMQQTDLVDTSFTISGGGLTQSNLGANDSPPQAGATFFVPWVYTVNRLYYDPNIDYEPWKRDYGTTLADTPYTAAYSSRELASGSTINLQSNTQTFYAPKPTNTNLADLLQYYRYQILTSGRVVRAERLQYAAEANQLNTWGPMSANRNYWVNPSNLTNATSGGTGNTPNSSFQYTLSAATLAANPGARLVIRITGSSGNANLYARIGAAPNRSSTGSNVCNVTSSGSNDTCTINNPSAGTYWIGVAAANTSGANFTNVRLYVELVTDNNGPDGLGCDTSTSGWGWRNCTYATPTGRSEAAERQNFATWYSFHRTRMKAAKAGVSYAFSELGEEYRVGFDILGTDSTVRRPIPVSSDGGLFRNEAASTNRSAFFDDFFSVTASGYTPLRRALRRVGEYYRDATATGPYGGTGAAQLACRQNFAILTTDGYWNGNNDGDFNYASVSGDEDNGALISGPNGQTYQYTPVRPYSASAEGTLADVAMHYWKTDLRTNLDNIVPTSSNNPAFWQHMVTFGISLGLRGNLDPDTDLPALTAGTKTWGAVSTANDTDPDKIDDLWHAAVNSRGSFAAATDPQAFVAAIRSALASVVERTASGSNVSANSTSLTSDAMLFQGRFISGRWSGDLFAYSLAVSGSGNTPVWSASANIPAPGSRNILTWNGTGGATFPTTAQAAALNSPKAGVTNYIRGDRSLEASHGGTFRDRMHALGDIINSSPAFDPATNTVYVGANDGMLHAFNGATGVERFAYIPGNIDLVGLESLVEPDYAHRYFVDGPIAISPRSLTPNVSYLVGALGRGGRGVYGLNVTNPGSMGTGNVLWDFKTTAHAKMGMVLNTPVFARMNNGDVAVLVPNGPNSPADTAVLYVLNPTNGNVIAEIDTGTGTGWGGATAPNGLSGLRGYDYDGNGTVDLIYAGDLRGNVWKFDVSSNNPSNWTNATNRTILFTAVDGSGNRQPISGAPAIAIDPLTYNTWVYFGTGRFLNTDDIKDANNNPNLSVHTWYGLIDGDPITGRAQLQRRTIIASGTLNGRPVRAFEQPTSLDTTKRGWYIDLLRPPVPGTAQGERIIADTAVVGSRVIVPSIVPTSSDCDAGGTGFVNVLDAFTGASPPGAFFDLDGDGVFTDDVITLDNGQTVPVGSVSFVDGMPTGSGVIVPPAGSGSTIGRYEVGGTGGARGGAAADLSQIYSRKSWRELTGD